MKITIWTNEDERKKENDKRIKKKEKLMNEWKKNKWMKERERMETIDKWRVKYVNK